MLRWLDRRAWASRVRLTSLFSFSRCLLGDSRIIRKSVAATTAGADDAMPARRVKAIFGFMPI
jgi:hypothetical protein